MQPRAHGNNNGPGYAQHPDHIITLEKYRGEIKVSLSGVTIAVSPRLLVMHETHYAPVYYFPRRDIFMALLVHSEHSTYCPFKGHARYWTIGAGGKTLVDAAWCYETPYDEVLAIKDYIAFHNDKLDVYHGADQ